MTATRTVPCLLAAILVTGSAGAQEPPRDPIAAEALFERGKELVDHGRTTEACKAFAESQRLDPAGGTLLRLALCHEAEGKLASAWLEFLEVQRVSSEATGDPAKLAERARIAREHLAAIGPRLPKLVLAVPTASRTAGLSVSANGLPRNEGSWGVPLPVDPGDVLVIATAPGRRETRLLVHVREGQQTNVDILPLALETTPSPAAATTRSSPLRPVGLALGAAGVVAIGVGSYFGARAISKWNASNDVCPGTSCATPGGVALAGDARDAARAADVSFALGAVAVVAGVILYVAGAAAPSTRALGAPVVLSF